MGIYDRHYYNDDDLEPIRMGWSARSMVSTLIIINAAIQLINLLLGRDNPLLRLLWLQTSEMAYPWNWYRFLTYGFAHSQDIMHVLFNMLTLFFLGRAVEEKYGRYEFLRIYLVSIVWCGIAWTISNVINGDRNSILVGASGGVTTIALLFVFSFPHAVLRIWGIIPIRAWMFGILLVGGNLVGTSQIYINGKTHVAYDVHLFGAAFAAAYFFSKWNIGKLGAWWNKLSTYIPFRKSRLKLHRPAQDNNASSRAQREADRILEKIHRDGQESLTSRERRFLEDYSRTVRKNRGKARR